MTKFSWVRTTIAFISLYTLAPLSTADELGDARPGDLIFREGTEFVSNAVLAIDNGSFSHVGMLAKQDDQWVVIHSSPAEIPGRIDGVVIDPLSFFIAPEQSRYFSVYQVDATDAERQSAVDWAIAKEGTPFRVFGVDAIYCTTLVWKAWQMAGINLEPTFSRLAIPLAEGEYLLPSGLLSSPKLTRLPQ